MRVLSFDVGLKFLAYCDITYIKNNEENTNDIDDLNDKNKENKKIYHINDWNVCNISVENEKYDINNTITPILDFLTKTFSEKETYHDYILIENQPVIKNPIMKSIQMIIFTFFHMIKYQKGLINQKIQFIAASNKCKCIKFLEEKQAKEISDKVEIEAKSNKGYKYNKKLSQDLCVVFMDDFIISVDRWRSMYNSNKKKDDLADSLLQAIYFINSENISKQDILRKKDKKDKKDKKGILLLD